MHKKWNPLSFSLQRPRATLEDAKNIKRSLALELMILFAAKAGYGLLCISNFKIHHTNNPQEN